MEPVAPTHLGVGPLQLRILEVLWKAGIGLTVTELHEALQKDRKLAYTTVLTVARNLAKRNLVTQQPVAGARKHLFTTTLTREAFLNAAMAEVVSMYFHGDKAACQAVLTVI